MLIQTNESEPVTVPNGNYELAGASVVRVAGQNIFMMGSTGPVYCIHQAERDGLGFLIRYYNIKKEGHKRERERNLIQAVIKPV